MVREAFFLAKIIGQEQHQSMSETSNEEQLQHVNVIDASYSEQLQETLSLSERLEKASSLEGISSAVTDALFLIKALDEGEQSADLSRSDVLEGMRAILAKRMQTVIIPKVYATLWEKVKEEYRQETRELSEMKKILQISPCSNENEFEVIMAAIGTVRAGHTEYLMQHPGCEYDKDGQRMPPTLTPFSSWRVGELDRISK